MEVLSFLVGLAPAVFGEAAVAEGGEAAGAAGPSAGGAAAGGEEAIVAMQKDQEMHSTKKQAKNETTRATTLDFNLNFNPAERRKFGCLSHIVDCVSFYLTKFLRKKEGRCDDTTE